MRISLDKKLRSYEYQLDGKDERIYHYQSKYLSTGSSRLDMLIKVGSLMWTVRTFVKYYNELKIESAEKIKKTNVENERLTKVID